MSLKPLEYLFDQSVEIKRALISVSNKAGLSRVAEKLAERGVEIVSTGGTANLLKESGVKVQDVTDVTGFPECLDGRVKTLHPSIHGGILARTGHQPDLDEIERLGIRPFDLVIVNLYPFRETISRPDTTPATATEYIDIGGPTLIRAAAKNTGHVCVVTSPDQYDELLEALDSEDAIPFELRRKWALEAFRHTADYDMAISNWFSDWLGESLPDQWMESLPKRSALRYGENPHQKAAVYGNPEDWYEVLHGKELSYNNYLDIDAALNLISEFPGPEPVAAIFKHTVPCGAASGSSLLEAWNKAFATDTVSPFGGIVCINKKLDPETARAIDKIFTEIILAPDYDPEALKLLKEKKNRRLIRIKKFPDIINGEPKGQIHASTLQYRSITGGALIQQADRFKSDTDQFEAVTRKKADKRQWNDLMFAWSIVKHIKSNAIVYVKNLQTVGIGTGQTSRVDSSEIAIRKAKKEGLSLEGSVIASDAFFPFADGVEAAAKAGATAVIQPGGSVRDSEVIEAAEKLGLVMVFTGRRHFRH